MLDGANITEFANAISQRIVDKFYNLYCSSREIKSDSLTVEAKRYLYWRYWCDGRVCYFNIPNTNLLGLCQYAETAHDMYHETAKVQPIYVDPTSKTTIPLVPQHELVVNKDCVISYYQRNKKAVYYVVKDYADQMADVMVCLNMNLQLHKIPFVITAADEDTVKRVKHTLAMALGGGIAVTSAEGDINSLTSLNTATPYIIDKLYTFYCDLENELKTYLGLSNSGTYQKASHTLEAEMQSSLDFTAGMADNVTDCLEETSKQIKEVLGKTVTFTKREVSQDQVDHMDREKANGEAYKEGGSNNE